MKDERGTKGVSSRAESSERESSQHGSSSHSSSSHSPSSHGPSRYGSVEHETLSEKEQTLLYRFYDNQLGVIDRFRVQLLLRRTPAAVAFLRQCDINAAELRNSFEDEVRDILKDISEEQVWQHIDARVAHNRQAEVLGRRSAAQSWWLSATGQLGDRLRWGFSGATCGALASAVVMYLWVPQVSRTISVDVAGNVGAQLGARGGAAAGAFTGQEPSQMALLSSPEAQQIDQALKFPGSNDPSSRTIGDRGVMERDEFSGAGGLTHNVALGGASSEYRRQGTGDDQYDLSRAIAAALAERARRESLASQPLMSVAQDPRTLGGQSAAGAARGAAGSSVRTADGPGALFGRSPRAIEVDWMRSRGRVRMFHDPVEKTAYIWVNPTRGFVSRAAPSQSQGGTSRHLGAGPQQFSNASSSVSSFY
jgi:hypothetical protein